MTTKIRATVEDLYRVPEHGKAEIIDGELVRLMPTGGIPSVTGGNIHFSLKLHEREHGGGGAIGDNAGFIVDLPNRESFSPDAAWWTGGVTMKFFDGAPAFAAGTLVVWDVDPLSDAVVKVYRADSPDEPTVYRRGQVAEAAPAVPGWRMPVDELFR
jgi:Uma2 family endonuclease